MKTIDHRRGVDSRPAALELQQTYEPIGGEMTLRTIGGSAIGKSHGRSGARRLPAADGCRLACRRSITLRRWPWRASCRVLYCAPGCPATLPAARRSDTGYVPWGVALMADQTTQITAATMAGNVATLDAVAGAIGYRHVLPSPAVLRQPAEGAGRA